uniref:Uncharacterized protein n=1 Tax=Arundo donax TaxID=35708 RepID=A0A0A9D7K3_ARUDO
MRYIITRWEFAGTGKIYKKMTSTIAHKNSVHQSEIRTRKVAFLHFKNNPGCCNYHQQAKVATKLAIAHEQSKHSVP